MPELRVDLDEGARLRPPLLNAAMAADRVAEVVRACDEIAAATGDTTLQATTKAFGLESAGRLRRLSEDARDLGDDVTTGLVYLRRTEQQVAGAVPLA